VDPVVVGVVEHAPARVEDEGAERRPRDAKTLLQAQLPVWRRRMSKREGVEGGAGGRDSGGVGLREIGVPCSDEKIHGRWCFAHVCVR
jgi:hypothetical protein